MASKRSKLAAVLVLAAGLIALSRPAFAHHSLVNYDRQNGITLTGTVTEFVLKNPHALVVFEVKGRTAPS